MLIKIVRGIISIANVLDRADIPLFGFLSSKTKRNLVRKFYKPFTSRLPDVIELNGLRFYMPRWLDYAYVFQEHEHATQRLIRQHLRAGMVALDIGANIGYLTLLMARIVGLEGKVYAVEPGPDNLDLLRKNIQLNDFSNITVLPYAAGAECRSREFHLHQRGTLHSLHAQAGSTGKTITVQEMPLDEVINDRVDFVKMDVEGAEIEALKGMNRILDSNPHIRMIVEWNPSALRRAGHSAESLPALLQKAEFELSMIDDNKREYIKSIENVVKQLNANRLVDWHTNFFAERNNKYFKQERSNI